MSTQTTRQSASILAALAFCMALQMTGFVMFLPLFARRFESFGAGVEALGVSAMAYALTSTFAAPFIGMLADRFGRRPIILVSLAAYVLAFSGYLFAASAWLLILLRGLAGVFTAGLLPAMTSIVGDLARRTGARNGLALSTAAPQPGGLPVVIGWAAVRPFRLCRAIYRFDCDGRWRAAPGSVPDPRDIHTSGPSQSPALGLDAWVASAACPVDTFPAHAHHLWCDVRLGVHRATIHVLRLR